MSADDSQHVVNLATGNRWSAYKHLYKVLSSVVAGGKETSELESILRRHKPDFVSLMQNPVSLVAPRLLASHPFPCSQRVPCIEMSF